MDHKFDFKIFQHKAQLFLEELSIELLQNGIPTRHLKSDHLCFRVSSMQEYEFYKQALVPHGELLTEALVNGRAISTFRLHSPFRTDTHEVPLLELPAPKSGTQYSTGFEHAEFVIDECFTQFKAKFTQLHFTESGNQTLNPELCLKLKDGKQAKFHHLSLDRVIEIEEAKIQDIIFDFDGTLINSRESIHEINRIVFSKILDRELSLQESIEKFQPDFWKLFEAFAVSCPVRQNEAFATWGSISETFSYELFEGARETLIELQSHGFRLHLWTARDEYSARKILKAHDLEDFFITLSFANNTDSKPHTNSLSLDWKMLGQNQVIMIGDSPADIIGAKNISAIRGAALWDPYSKKSSLIETGAELFFHKTAELKNWLIKSGQPRVP